MPTGSRPRRAELRAALGGGRERRGRALGRAARAEKGLDVLVRRGRRGERPAARARRRRRRAGARAARASRAELGVRLVLAGDVEWERIVELYVAADVFALLSEREPWAVVVNEAAACGLPLVLSDRVGAAHDLLRDGENGAPRRRRRRRRRRARASRARRRCRAPSRAGRALARARARTGATGRASRASSRPCARRSRIGGSLIACPGNASSS